MAAPHRRARSEADPPYVGALLRICWQRARDHMHAAIRAAGFSDLQDAHFVVFSYPLPDGARPTELARRLRMSRQAANYLIGQLERLGYLERRPAPGGDKRLVYLTERGWRVAEVIYASLRRLQEEWAEEVGRDRFDQFIDVLRRLSSDRRGDAAASRHA
jgi:DNA-binding MarR family transcriptional regulator